MHNRVNHNKSRSGLTAALDIGTTKIGCMIASAGNGTDKEPRVVGFGHQISHGMRSGVIVDIDGVEAAIRSTVEAAEQMAGENIKDVVVNLSSSKIKSRLIAYEISIAGHKIDDADIRRILEPQALNADQPEDRELIHTIPVGYSIDGNRGVRDPRGMYGERLGVNMHTISATHGPMRNLESVVARCHLGIDSMVVTPFASSLACLVDDEKQMGVTYIDFGGGTTSVAVFFDGELVHTDAIPVGGQHITNDIARGLATSMPHAERMKTLYGNVIPSASDDHAVIKVPLVGEENSVEENQVPRSMLVGIIRPRVEETLELVRDRLIKAGFDKVAGRRAVISGGASQLLGLPELTGKILDKQVRVGVPKALPGAPERAGGAAFSTCIGLLRYAFDDSNEIPNFTYGIDAEPSGRFGRLGQWLKENF
jgi:cell division protein FtsA